MTPMSSGLGRFALLNDISAVAGVNLSYMSSNLIANDGGHVVPVRQVEDRLRLRR
jgi:hypothetical protein